MPLVGSVQKPASPVLPVKQGGDGNKDTLITIAGLSTVTGFSMLAFLIGKGRAEVKIGSLTRENANLKEGLELANERAYVAETKARELKAKLCIEYYKKMESQHLVSAHHFVYFSASQIIIDNFVKQNNSFLQNGNVSENFLKDLLKVRQQQAPLQDPFHRSNKALRTHIDAFDAEGCSDILLDDRIRQNIDAMRKNLESTKNIDEFTLDAAHRTSYSLPSKAQPRINRVLNARLSAPPPVALATSPVHSVLNGVVHGAATVAAAVFVGPEILAARGLQFALGSLAAGVTLVKQKH